MVIHVRRKKRRKRKGKRRVRRNEAENLGDESGMPARVVASATSNSVSLGARFSPARAFYFRSTRGKRFPPQDIYRGSRLFRDSFDPGKSSQLLRRRSGVGVDPPEGTGFAFSELISIDFVFSDSFLSHREFFTAILRKMTTKMHRVSNPINFNLIE